MRLSNRKLDWNHQVQYSPLGFPPPFNLMWAPGSGSTDGLPRLMLPILLSEAQTENDMKVDKIFQSSPSPVCSVAKNFNSNSVHVSTTSHFLHIKTTQGICTSTYIMWFSSSLLIINSQSLPQTIPKACCTNLAKIQNINHRCLSSWCKHWKAILDTCPENLLGSERQPRASRNMGPISSCTSESVLSKASLLPLHKAAAECDKDNLAKNRGLQTCSRDILEHTWSLRFVYLHETINKRGGPNRNS